jgi:HEAT repeat protein
MQWWVTQKLKSKSSIARREAVQSIGEEGDAKHVQLLTTSLSDRDVAVRLAAVQSLARIKDEVVLPPLLAALRDPDPAVREAGALSLRGFGDKRTIPYLKPLLKDPVASVRAAVARCLQQIGWEPADARERVRVLVALGEYHQAAALGETAFDDLVDALRDKTHFTRRFALEALARLEDKRVADVLADSLTDHDVQVRVAAAEELANFQGDEYVVALSQTLSDPEPLLRAAAANSLSRMGNATCVPFLMDRLQDDHWSVRKASVDALGQMGCPEALERLSAVLKDSDHDVREATVIAMGRIGDQRAVEHLVGALADATSSVRSAAAAVLNVLDPEWQTSDGAQRAMAVLQPLTQAREYWVRHAASSVLARMKGDARPEDKDPLLGPAESASKRIQVLQILMRAMEDFDRDVRLAATEALGRLEDNSCAGQLRLLLKDPDEWVQLAAGKALQQVSRQRMANSSRGLKLRMH